jgi:parallel beta-helix repeat protein
MRVPGHQRKSYPGMWTAALAGLAVLTFALVMALAVRPAEVVHAANFTVNLYTDAADLNDDGSGGGVAGDGIVNGTEVPNGTCDTDAGTTGSQCSLRAAIFEANGNGDTADNITFGTLSGTITLTAGLPLPVGNGGTVGDGFSNSTTIDSNLNVTVHGGAFPCFIVTSASNVIRDLNITGCSRGVEITGDPADGNAVRGNTIYSNTSDGVHITASADNNTVGGTVAADRNIIRDNGSDGVGVVGGAATSGNLIEGNCIGTAATCSIAAPNGGNGVEINADNTTVGGTAAGAGNTIAFNTLTGVDIAGGTNNIVTRNVMFLNTGVGIASGAPPTLTGCADAGGGNVSCTGNAVAGDIIDVYHANVDASGSEGDLFLCTNVAGGGGAWGCTFANPGGGSATATSRTPGANTSRFANAVGIPAGPVITYTPTPTSTPLTPTPTPTATGTPPTPTATGTPATATPTRTPTVGPMESVTLVGGVCNPVANTYPDGTSIDTIADGVSPEGILISIWKFDTASGIWRGYSPQFPQANDLTGTQVNRLDAIFICVSSAGTWLRPLI